VRKNSFPYILHDVNEHLNICLFKVWLIYCYNHIDKCSYKCWPMLHKSIKGLAFTIFILVWLWNKQLYWCQSRSNLFLAPTSTKQWELKDTTGAFDEAQTQDWPITSQHSSHLATLPFFDYFVKLLQCTVTQHSLYDDKSKYLPKNSPLFLLANWNFSSL